MARPGCGTWPIAARLSWADFARAVARATSLDEQLVQGVPGAELGWTARRPAHAALASRRGKVMPTVEDALSRFAVAMASTSRPPRTPRQRIRTGVLEDVRSFAAALEA